MFIHSNTNRVTLERDEVYKTDNGNLQRVPVKYVNPNSAADLKLSGHKTCTDLDEDVDNAITQVDKENFLPDATNKFATPRKRKAVLAIEGSSNKSSGL
jgi:CCR4-NOT transcriptional regulation complex NOT5 subunit